MKKLFYIFFISALLLNIQSALPDKSIVNVYNWTEGIAPEVIKQFEDETGIKVNYDVYDSAEAMEAKLLAGHSGYDVVFASVWPYLARQVRSGLYMPLNKTLLGNYHNLDKSFLKRMKAADPQNKHLVPYVWGTTGFGYRKNIILKIMPDAPLESLAMLFDPKIVSQFQDCGVMLLDSPADVFPAALAYLGLDPNSSNPKDLKKAVKTLMQIRPYIKKFQAASSSRDIISNDYCLVQSWSGELIQAKQIISAIDDSIEIGYTIPKEGAPLWIDAMAIPQDAKHIKEAHQFINFLMRPKIIAKITNAIGTANVIPSALKYVKPSLKNDPMIYLSKRKMKKLYIDKVQSPQYERLRLREWTRVKTGR